MSKIEITQLSANISKFDDLNDSESINVVGGRGYSNYYSYSNNNGKIRINTNISKFKPKRNFKKFLNLRRSYKRAYKNFKLDISDGPNFSIHIGV